MVIQLTAPGGFHPGYNVGMGSCILPLAPTSVAGYTSDGMEDDQVMGLGAVLVGSISVESLSLPNHSVVMINNEVIG